MMTSAGPIGALISASPGPETIAEADLNTLNSGLGFLFGRLREAQAEFHEEGDNGRRGDLHCARRILDVHHAFQNTF
jgi:hypothetical protein